MIYFNNLLQGSLYIMFKAGWMHLSPIVFVFARSFIDGCEIYLILPTAWYYMKSIGQTERYLAVVLISFNVAAVVMTPLFGLVGDRLGHVKLLIITSFMMKVLGNLFYCIREFPVFPLLGRVLAGMGEGSNGLVFRYVALNSSKDERVKMFVLLDGAYCLGSSFGPAIGSVITFKATFMGLKIDAGNSPGIILFCVWSVFLVWSFFLPGNLDEKVVSDHVDSLASSDSAQHDETITEKYMTQNREVTNKKWQHCNSEVICLFYLIFCSEFFSSTASFSTPLLAEEVLKLKLIHVKLYFINSSLMNFVFYAATYIASNRFDERRIVTFFITIQIIALSLLTSLALTWTHFSYIQYYILLFYVTLGSPYIIFVLSCSLLSKITDLKNAGLFQDISLATVHSSIIIGRILPSFVFTQTGMVYFSVCLVVLWLFGAVWYAFAFEKSNKKMRIR